MSGAQGRLDAAFAEQARRTPEAVAVEDRDRQVTYARLEEAGDEVRERLRRADVPGGGLVGLALPRAWQVVPAILGIWRHGCGYVPVDPAYPAPRRRYLTSDAGLRHVVALGGSAGPDGLPEVEAVADAGASPQPEVPADTAYVIYTSGSTGDPKGVVVTHGNVASLFAATEQLFDFGPDDVWSQFHSQSFDFSVWEVWGPLLSGGRCVIVPPDVAADGPSFARLLADRGVTVLNQVPSVFAHLVRSLADQPVALPALRHVVFGGEAVNVPAVLDWDRLGVAPESRLWNMYGITEITVHGTLTLLDPRALRRPSSGTPIGDALPHLEMVLLEGGRPVPDGTPGEIHVTGDGVAWGYLGRPELTEERFATLDFDGGQRRWYRTGDYALRGPRGLEFLGRRDEQVKLHGFRIELGEIEAALRDEPGVADCAVVLAEPSDAAPHLAAWYVPDDGVDAEGAAGADLGPALRDALRAALPRHMVPARFLATSALPQTLSGKLDRGALAQRAVANA